MWERIIASLSITASQHLNENWPVYVLCSTSQVFGPLLIQTTNLIRAFHHQPYGP